MPDRRPPTAGRSLRFHGLRTCLENSGFDPIAFGFVFYRHGPEMLHILLNTILPIFSVIFLGYLLNRKRIINAEYARAANQIVFNTAIPAMLLSEIAQAPFRENFNSAAAVGCLAALAVVASTGLAISAVLKLPRGRKGTFLQSSFHGNIGYMAYAIAFYALGEGYFAGMAILSSFIIVAQNVLGVWALNRYGEDLDRKPGGLVLLKEIFRNPIVITVAAGIVYSALGFSIPTPIKKGLEILSGMAFPTALLLIGASLSFGSFRAMFGEILGIGILKMVWMPFLGYAFMKALSVPEHLVLPGVILLASPPATVTYVMASELGGDTELAATSVSIFTLASAFTYSAILAMLA